MKNYIVLFACILAFAVSSCSSLRIEKRHYNGGFYIETGSKNKTSGIKAEVHSAEIDNVDAKAEQVSVIAESSETAAAPTPVTPQTAVRENVYTNTAAGNEVNSSEPQTTSETNKSKEAKKQNAVSGKEKTSAPASDVPLWVYVILAILIPPLAVYLKQGLTNMFWIDLILFLLGYGLFRFTPYLWGAAFAAVVIALLVVFDVL